LLEAEVKRLERELAEARGGKAMTGADGEAHR
jgi:hypothetical protein